ncbi:hypothetical protein CCACVL1_30815 [Corchorus capsularis]|uniref:Uncharacterized protein n=1 Tax=Corchorus capsularis TaxID=210143 RepID=A0A1R3FV82_COCAP|nr:hypothetical protein CCACVL1_30815 [Corchorus capsularis]
MPPFLPNCSPSFQSWWAGQWNNIIDKENVKVIVTRLSPGGKRIAKPKKRLVASNQSSDDEENEAPLKVNKKKKPTLNASTVPASSNPSDDHPIAEVKKPKMTKPSPTVSSSPLPALKPASFIPQVTPSALGLSTSSNPFKTSVSTPFGYTSGPNYGPSVNKTLDFDTPLDLTLASPTGPPAKETLRSPKPVTPKPTPTKTSSSPSSSFQDTIAKLNRLSSALDQA